MKLQRIHGLVLLTVGLAAVATYFAWVQRQPNPGLWALVSFTAISLFLEETANPLRLVAFGSTSFVIHLAAGLLFGGFWAAVIAGTSTGISQVYRGQPVIKVLFNTFQRVLCVTLGVMLYVQLGGHVPPAYVDVWRGAASWDIQRDLGLFFAFAGVYFAINSLAVNAAVALSSGRPFREVWNLNAKGVLGYDLGGSSIAIMLVLLYEVSRRVLGFGELGLILVLAPILAIRHVYGLYRKLQNSGRELLDLMVKAIEARDPYTSGHSIRVATVSKAIAQELRLSVDSIEEVYTAALLHDVGKIHEEFAPLLRKESKLTPEETALLQTHPAKSADLVGLISSFRGNVQLCVRHHHERWDGGGYPDGVAGESIPLGARIIMMADTADAMMTDRPYRRRLPIEAVVGEFLKYRGAQFDPTLVDVVVSSVTIRRILAELGTGDASPAVAEARSDGGSRRVSPAIPRGIFGTRASWPRAKAF
jgi:HD-GYP domain-containing protein (c-di-GMP phosphodiesterase class II)